MGTAPEGLAEAAVAAWAECGKPFTLPIRGTSMHPFLRAGDAVRIAPLQAGQLRLGDVMAFWREGQVTLHRFAGWSGGRLRQKGDNIPGYSLIEPETVIGRAQAILSPRGDRDLEKGRGLWKNRLLGLKAWAFCVIRQRPSWTRPT